MRRNTKVMGEKLLGLRDKMNHHLVHNTANRMYWCGCMPVFRVGAEIHHPSSGRSKTFSHYFGSRHLRTYWRRRPALSKGGE